MQIEFLPLGQEDLLLEPLLVTVELRVRLQRSVGRHGEKRTLELLATPQHLVDFQLAPELLQDVHPAVGPRVDHSYVWLRSERLLA